MNIPFKDALPWQEVEKLQRWSWPHSRSHDSEVTGDTVEAVEWTGLVFKKESNVDCINYSTGTQSSYSKSIWALFRETVGEVLRSTWLKITTVLLWVAEWVPLVVFLTVQESKKGLFWVNKSVYSFEAHNQRWFTCLKIKGVQYQCHVFHICKQYLHF